MSNDDINTTTETVGADDTQNIASLDPKTMQLTGDIPEDEDVHICAKCKIPFTSLEAYFEHKMTSETCGKEFNNTRKNLLKRLGPRRGRPPGRRRQLHDSAYTPAIVKKEFHSEEKHSTEETKVKLEDKGEKYNRLKLHHRMSDIIPNTVLYKCDQCNSQFRREAALKRHKEYDHREKDSDESSEEEETYRKQILSVDKYQETDESQSTSVSQLSLQSANVQYVETVTFHPSTGLYTTSSTPTIIEASMAYVVPTTDNQTEDPASAKQSQDGRDPDYVCNKVNNMRSGRGSPRISVSSRRASQHSSNNNVCSKCGRNFANALTLRTHQLTHSNIRNFKCTVPGCSYAFKTKGSLKRHLRRHTGERPYKCKLCHRAFRESGALNRHLKGRVPCTDKTDSDFPRYKKNLKLPTAVNNRQENVDSHNEQASDIPSQEVEKKDETIHNETKSGSENMIILVSVPVLDNQENDAITTESQCSFYDNSQVLPEQMMMMTVSEDELNTNQGLSLVIEDSCQNNEVYAKASQEEISSSESNFANSSLVETANVLNDPILEREEGELVEIKGEEPLIVESEVQDGKEEEQSPTEDELLVCKVDGQRFANRTELMSHLKTHLINVNYHCEKCNYFSESRAQMDEHLQLTHHKQWDTQDENNEQDVVPGTESDVNTVQTVTMPTETLSTVDNMEAIHFVSTDNQVSEEVVSHDNEINMAISPLESNGNVNLPETIDTSTMGLDGTEQNTEKGSNYITSNIHDSSTSSEENSRSAITALEQLMALCQSSGPHHDYCQFDKSQCPACGKRFKGHAYLKFHLRTHTGEKAFKCDQCTKSFATKDALHKHYMAHSMDKNYKCGECGKLFKRISHVREHLKVHTNERPYSCKLCQKTFKTVNACKVHIRTHSHDLQYKCDRCKKQFREKGSLDRHTRTHTGEKPYPCPHCGRRFAEHGTLNRHLKAKVPCTRALQQIRHTGDLSQFLQQSVDLLTQEKDSIPNTTQESFQLTDLSQAIKLEYPSEDSESTRQHVKVQIFSDGQVKEERVISNEETTVLREFSSVVADTQYIIDPQQQESAEYIMVSEGQTEVTMQDNGDDTTSNKAQEQVRYIVMENENIIFIDQKGGEQIKLLTSDGQSNNIMMDGMEVISGGSADVQQVIEMPPGEEIIAMGTDNEQLMLDECVVNEERITEQVLQDASVT